MFLVRHAHAGSRSQWSGPDSDRPVSAKGRHQAAGIIQLLDGAGVTSVRSSPATRCVETVEPLAAAHGLTVIVDPVLAEGGDAQACIQALLDPPVEGLVLCSHGDLIPKIIRRLSADGMRTKDPNLSQKGSIWVVELDGSRAVSARYLPPQLG